MSQKEPELIDARRKEVFVEGFRSLEHATETTSVIEATGVSGRETVSQRFDMNKFREAWYHYEFAPRSKNEIYQKVMGKMFSVSINEIIGMAIQYLRGIAWNYAYYTGGTYGANVRWYYNYYRAPLIVDVAAVLKLKVNEGIDGWEHDENSFLFNPIHQLLAVLPRASRRLLPREVISLISARSPISDYYPENFIIDKDGVTKSHLGVAILPFVDPDRIIDAVAAHCSFHDNVIKQYMPVADTKYTRTVDPDEIAGREREYKMTIRGRGQPQRRAGYVQYEYRGSKPSRGGRGGERGGRGSGRVGERGDRGAGGRGNAERARGRGRRGGERGGRGSRGRREEKQQSGQMIPMTETVMVIQSKKT